MPLRQIRDRLLGLMDDERAQVDRLMSQAIALGQKGLDASEVPGVVVDGAEVLLSRPELADLTRVRTLFETFAEKAQLVDVLNRCLEGAGVRVLIGEDTDLTSKLDFSLVGTTYGVGERAMGSLGIFGPSRMEYQRMVPLVHHLGEVLSRALAATL
jgi:heat-inducible transcriptional repressor